MSRDCDDAISQLGNAGSSAERARILSDVAVKARIREAQTAFVNAGLHVTVAAILQSSVPDDGGDSAVYEQQHADHRHMQAQAARVLGNLSAHQHQNKAAVVAAGGLEALAGACEVSLGESQFGEDLVAPSSSAGGTPASQTVREGARALLVETSYALGNLASGTDARTRCAEESSGVVQMLLRILRMRSSPGVQVGAEDYLRTEIACQAARALSNLAGTQAAFPGATTQNPTVLVHETLAEAGVIAEGSKVLLSMACAEEHRWAVGRWAPDHPGRAFLSEGQLAIEADAREAEWEAGAPCEGCGHALPIAAGAQAAADEEVDAGLQLAIGVLDIDAPAHTRSGGAP
eukprot:5230277-Prymnesium_polylepis.1